MELSVIILTLNEKDNTIALIPRLRRTLASIMSDLQYELIVVDGGSSDGTTQVAAELADHVLVQTKPGYGQALREGLAAAKGEYVATLDADLSHEPTALLTMWQERTSADIIIASRYVAGGVSDMPLIRVVLSRILNSVFRTALSLPVRDMSSGFRLYKAQVLSQLSFTGSNFDALPEILVRCYADGWLIRELPFHYLPRRHGGSKARLLRFGLTYLSTLARMWRLRNSIESADYDERAYDSKIPFQRYWQRKRRRIITNWVPNGVATLDIGCGSSRILRDLDGVVGLDIRLNKLRYMRQYSQKLVGGTIFTLPFLDESFECVICSEVIEHVADDEQIFSEMHRVLCQGGMLIIGTPDYGSRLWVWIEAIYKRVMPDGYADEHITHYTLATLKERLEHHGFRWQQGSSILGAEIILRLEKERA